MINLNYKSTFTNCFLLIKESSEFFIQSISQKKGGLGMKETLKRLFKKLLFTVFDFHFSQMNVGALKEGSQGQHSQEGHVDVLDIIDHPDKYPDIDVTLYESANDFMTVIHEGKNLSLLDKLRLVNEVHIDQLQASTYAYLTLTFTARVTSTYTCYPYFYTKFQFDGFPESTKMVNIMNANIDRNDKGKSKQFSGSLYYNLEAGNSLYWDLNGDFYNNGTTTWNAGISIGISESTSAKFEVNGSIQHYSYAHVTGRYQPVGLQP